ncbi:hypothetical protein QTP88_027684 [Uroleucon formosanum]
MFDAETDENFLDGFKYLCDTFTDLLGVSDTFLALLGICIDSSLILSTSHSDGSNHDFLNRTVPSQFLSNLESFYVEIPELVLKIKYALELLTSSIQSAALCTSITKINKSSHNKTPQHIQILLDEKRKARAKWQKSKYPNDKIKLNQLSNKLKKLSLQLRPSSHGDTQKKLQSPRYYETKRLCNCACVFEWRHSDGATKVAAIDELTRLVNWQLDMPVSSLFWLVELLVYVCRRTSSISDFKIFRSAFSVYAQISYSSIFASSRFVSNRLKMRYVAAYLLASLSGKEPSSDDVEKILSSVGIESDSSKLSLVIKELKGKNVDEVIESGKYYLFVNK